MNDIGAHSISKIYNYCYTLKIISRYSLKHGMQTCICIRQKKTNQNVRATYSHQIGSKATIDLNEMSPI